MTIEAIFLQDTQGPEELQLRGDGVFMTLDYHDGTGHVLCAASEMVNGREVIRVYDAPALQEMPEEAIMNHRNQAGEAKQGKPYVRDYEDSAQRIGKLILRVKEDTANFAVAN